MEGYLREQRVEWKGGGSRAACLAYPGRRSADAGEWEEEDRRAWWHCASRTARVRSGWSGRAEGRRVNRLAETSWFAGAGPGQE